MSTAKAQPASSEGFFLGHDMLVHVVAIGLLLGGWLLYTSMTAPTMKPFDREGLTFSYPAGWIPESMASAELPIEVTYVSLEEASLRVSARISKKPGFDGQLQSVLDLSRGRRYGEFYKKLDTASRTVGGKEWARTEFVYAFKATEDDAPQIAYAVEYGLVNNDNLYVVTVHGPRSRLRGLEHDVLGSLSLE